MQKKLIALAVAGLVSAPVFAQSNIQIYGVADAYMKYGDFMGDDAMGVDSGGLAGSRIGFRGEEDLGSGLKAVFVLEQGINIDSGKSTGMTGDDDKNSGDQTFTRQAYVGLKGNFGQVALGRQYAPGYFIYAYDALLSATPSPQSWLSLLGNLTITPNSPARWNNAVAYDGVFQSVSLSAIYSAGNRESDSGKNLLSPNGKRVDYDDDDKYGLALRYDNGPLKVGAIYHGIKYSGQNVSDKYAKGDDTQKEWFLGASYNFGMATLAGSYQQGRDVMGVNGFDVDLWQVGVIVPVGVGNIHFSYGQADLDKVDNVLSRDVKPKSFTVAYTHAFSKRTTGYLGYNKIDYDDLTWNDAFNLGQTDSSFNGHSGTGKVDDTDLFFVGMSHSF
ncbi:porin [Tepidiphilus succinatimandens]|uniref:porin n=1 Tax=Tepidiphilus succinatimandens TaxID=224436 RepID=UPI00112F4547|nr:porin [Tepidiphilus succinatimandens]